MTPLLAFLLGLFCGSVDAVRTLSLSNLLMTGTQEVRLPSLESVSAGVQRGLDECRRQFRWDLWDCPQEAFTVSPRDPGKTATREMAFVQAIVSAGLMHSLTRNCSATSSPGGGQPQAQRLKPGFHQQTDCGCDVSRKGPVGPEGWTWGGCSDNVRLGEDTSAEFLDGQKTATDVTAMANLHNNRVGRLAVRKTMRRLCKCHGVSGSCATKTCLMRLGDFHDVGDYLRQAYEKAIHLERNRPQAPESQDDSRDERLLYLETSPDYCHKNSSLGVEGTVGRECSRRKPKKGLPVNERKSCKTLCKGCGHGIRKRTVQVMYSCKCKFQWCCQVKCQQCKKTVQRFECVQNAKRELEVVMKSDQGEEVHG